MSINPDIRTPVTPSRSSPARKKVKRSPPKDWLDKNRNAHKSPIRTYRSIPSHTNLDEYIEGVLSKKITAENRCIAPTSPSRLAVISAAKEKGYQLSEQEATAETIMHERELAMDAIMHHRARAIQALPPKATKETAAAFGLQSLSKNMREESALLAHLKAVHSQENNPYRRRRLPPYIDPRTLFPSKASLYKISHFGKYDINKSWVTEHPELPQVTLPLLRSGFLDEASTSALRQTSPRFQHIVDLQKMTTDVDCRMLRFPQFEWEQAAEGPDDQILRDRMAMRTACLLQYDGSIESLQRFCGWRWMNEQMRTYEMLFWLQPILPEEDFKELTAGYSLGIPYCLKSSPDNSQEELQAYVKAGNSITANKHSDLCWKLMSKEDRRDVSFVLPSMLLPFLPNMWLIVLGVAAPEGRKPRIYRDCSKRITTKSAPINALIDPATEPRIGFGDTFKRYCTYLWHTRANFPTKRIAIMTDDEAGCFNQKAISPSLTSSMATVFDGVLMIAIGNHFGGSYGPACNEPVARAKEKVVQFLFDNCNFQQEANKEYLQHIQLDMPPLAQPLAQAKRTPEYPQQNEAGAHQFEYMMYIDDANTGTLAETSQVRQMVASSVEGTYILRSYPGPIDNPILTPVMAWDKASLSISTEAKMLGTMVNTDTMRISLPAARLHRFLDELRRNWNPNRKTFTARQAAVLQGNLISALASNYWLQALGFQFNTLLKLALKRNAERLLRSKRHLQEAFPDPNDVNLDPAADDKDCELVGMKNKWMRLLWKSKVETYIPAAIHTTAGWLRTVIEEELRYPGSTWYRPISHLVQREHDGTAYQDASSDFGVGGHSPDLCYWWQVEWTEFGPQFATWLRETLNQGLPTSSHINWLEYVAAIIQIAGMIVVYRFHKSHLPWPPVAKLIGDNNVANAVIKKRSSSSDSVVAAALGRLLSNILRLDEIGIRSGRVNTEDNKFADDLSRMPVTQLTFAINDMSNDALTTYLDPLSQSSGKKEWKTSYLRFHPSTALLSAICTAALEPQTIAFSQIPSARHLGQVSDGSNIFSNSL